MRPHNFSTTQRGMTLIEVIVTLGVLSVFFIGTLGIFSTTYANLRSRESLLNILDDSDLLMSYIGNDIRNAYKFLRDYQDEEEDRMVIAAMKIRQRVSNRVREYIIVYSLDAKHPNRLFRTVHLEDQTVTTEMSIHIDTVKIIPKSENLYEVRLTLQDQVAGKVSTLQTSSVYAMRY